MLKRRFAHHAPNIINYREGKLDAQHGATDHQHKALGPFGEGKYTDIADEVAAVIGLQPFRPAPLNDRHHQADTGEMKEYPHDVPDWRPLPKNGAVKGIRAGHTADFQRMCQLQIKDSHNRNLNDLCRPAEWRVKDKSQNDIRCDEQHQDKYPARRHRVAY